MEHGAAPEHPLGEVVGGASVGGCGRGCGRARGGGRRSRRGGGAAGVGGGGLHPPAASRGPRDGGRKREVGLGFGRLIRRLAGGREGEEAKLNWWWIQLPAATSEAGEPTAKRERGSARSTALVGPTSQPIVFL